MTVVLPHDEETRTAAPIPRLLYIGEFPPSNHHGGAILVKRLLEKHSANFLTIITSELGMRASPATDLLKSRHIVFPVLRASPSSWIGKLKRIPNCLILASVALRAVFVIKRRRVEAVISIVQGRYYLPAALAGWVTGTPHIAVVHDNFVSGNFITSAFAARVLQRLTRRILQSAAHIYAVSPEMQRLVLDECGMQSEIQLPSTTIPPRQPEGNTPLDTGAGPVILFAGTVGYTVKDCLDLLADLISSGKLKEYQLPKASLHLCTPLSDAEVLAFGWNRPGIVSRGWVPQSELARVLSSADILFLPYSFSQVARKSVETAFPSKIADYLAAGRPILVFGPKYSSLVRYAREQSFAEIVDEFSPTALARTIKKITFSPVDRQTLAARAHAVLLANHDMERQRRRFYRTLERVICASSGKESQRPTPPGDSDP
jgi:glycosyltransferase involved in cell wall biosynthesis